MFKRSISLFALIVVSTVTASCTPVSEPAAETAAKTPAFRPALDAHLATIAARDLEGFDKTLTSGDDLNVIFPNGTLVPDTQTVRDFHAEWFSDKDWVMEPEVIKVIEGKDMATALLKYSYRDSAKSEPRMNWLVLVFKLEDGAWKLVHDQNTKIEDATAG